MEYPFDCISNFIFVESALKKAQIILIPGSSQPFLMEKAAQLYHEGLAPYVLPSGGYNPRLPQYPSEWAFLAEIGERKGIPREAILKEDQARHTFDNAILSYEVITKAGLRVDRAILVCKGFHSRRALLTYQTCFPEEVSFYVSTVPDGDGCTRENWYRNEACIGRVMGEVAKIGTYFEKEIRELYKKKNRSITREG